MRSTVVAVVVEPRPRQSGPLGLLERQLPVVVVSCQNIPRLVQLQEGTGYCTVTGWWTAALGLELVVVVVAPEYVVVEVVRRNSESVVGPDCALEADEGRPCWRVVERG